MARKPHPVQPVALNLALQGGGSHGAFTWGVLDRLLDAEPRVFSGASGASAGALNAAVLATGLAQGGRPGAQAALRAFWMDVAAQGACFGRWAQLPHLAHLQQLPHLPQVPQVLQVPHLPGADLARYNFDSNPYFAAFYNASNLFLRAFSPYQFNPLGDNPLRAVLQRHVKLQALREGELKLFITATAVRTGQPRVFRRADLSVDALLASACLPQMFRAVEIDGEPYWDGGYSGNPAIWPLTYNTAALDVLLVKINPLVRPDLPDTPEEIADRVNEITFNAGLISEMRAIAFVQRLIEEGRVDSGEYKNLRLHMVADDAGLAPLHASSKLNTDGEVLQALHALGRAAADRFLLEHRADLGRRSTLDVRKTFLLPP